jgi:hypothetical protein
MNPRIARELRCMGHPNGTVLRVGPCTGYGIPLKSHKVFKTRKLRSGLGLDQVQTSWPKS